MAIIGIQDSLAVVWLALAVTLWVAKPDDVGLRDMLRLLPEIGRGKKARRETDEHKARRIAAKYGVYW